MKPLIVHQTQPCAVSCVSTCFAMILGVPVDEVQKSLHAPYKAQEVTIKTIFEQFLIPAKFFYGAEEVDMDSVGVYMIHVPSLNIQGGMHAILVEFTDEDWFVIDPVKGREGSKYYVKHGDQDESGMAVELNAFGVDAFIRREFLEKELLCR